MRALERKEARMRRLWKKRGARMDERGYGRGNGRYPLTVATRFLTLGAATILSCLLISVGMQQFRQARQIANIASRRMGEFARYLSQEELMAYDGVCLKGSDVVNFYRRFLYGGMEDFSMVIVKGDGIYTIAAGGQGMVLTDPEEGSYCRPDASYRCKVVRNVNDVILEVRFVQEE